MNSASLKKYRFLSRVLLLSIPLVVTPSKSNANELIQGFAQWQANRVERILLDQAIFGLTEDQYVQAFFPATTEAIDSYSNSTSASRLIPLIQAMIKDDINAIEKTFTTDIKNYLDIVVQQFKSNDIQMAINNIKAFEAEILKAKTTFPRYKWYNDFKIFVAAGPQASGKTAAKNITTLSKQTVSTKVSSAQANSVLINVNDYKVNESTFSDQDLLEKRLQAMVLLIQQYEDSKKQYDDPDESRPVVAIHFFVRFFELFGTENDNYTQFKSFGLFLGALIEADDAPGVAAVLDSFVDDQAAYRNKRLDANNTLFSFRVLPSYSSLNGKIEQTKYWGSCFACSNTLFIGSYFGAAVGHLTDPDSMVKQYNLRAFGPVGIEYKFLSVYGSPVTLTYAPIDVGNYVSNELRDVEYTARFSDIVAPSLFLSYSFRDKPFSINFGYQKDIKIGDDIEENTLFLSFTFDLPIYTVY